MGVFRIKQFNKEVYKTCSSDAVADMMWAIHGKMSKQHKRVEKMWILGLDNANNVMYLEVASLGTIDQAVVYPREIYRTCLLRDATRIIVVHNHPSGKLEASRHDIEITKKINEGADALDIELLDHIIINNKNKEYFSFRENGLVI